MRARHDLSTDLRLLTANKMSGGQQLFENNNLVIAGREQENWASYHRQINRASERSEAASCKLVVCTVMNSRRLMGSLSPRITPYHIAVEMPRCAPRQN